jgi:hypothetical protein
MRKHIHGRLVKPLGFIPTTHKKRLYSRPNPLCIEEMILWQVDDISISANTQEDCDIITTIKFHLKSPSMTQESSANSTG